MTEDSQNGICRRISQLRQQLDGARGRAAFAGKLGLAPSTYSYYEAGRTPPADVLVRIADLTGADLRWLLTGEASASVAVRADHPAVVRAAELLARSPDAAAPLAAFLDILSASMKFPAKAPAEKTAPAIPLPSWGGANPAAEPASARAGWIPVLGRSAAGVPQFWRDAGESQGVATLMERAAARNSVRSTSAATLAPSVPAGREEEPVQLVLLTDPDSDNVCEFVSAPALKARYGDAFALRVDGESMAPDIRHGELVVLSPSAPAVEGRAAVVQLSGQIGVTCKLYRLQEGRVHLVPVNEQFPPQSFPASKVLWSLAVLAKVRG